MASRYGKLPLDDSPRTAVFRAMDDVVRADPTMQRVFAKPGAIRSWRGAPEDKSEFAQQQAPALRLTPVPQSESWWYPGATKGDLVVQFELLVAGLVIDDAENLFYAVQRALVPRDQAALLAIHATLKAAGAETGLILFTDPAHDPSPAAGSDGQFRPVGMCKITVKTS